MTIKTAINPANQCVTQLIDSKGSCLSYFYDGYQYDVLFTDGDFKNSKHFLLTDRWSLNAMIQAFDSDNYNYIINF